MDGSDRPRLRLLASALLLGVFLVGYPLLVNDAVARFGVRTVAFVLLILALPSLLAGPRLPGAPSLGRLPQAAGALLVCLAFIRGDRLPLLLIPAVIQLFLLVWFYGTLSEPISIVERGALWMRPLLPAWVRSYCRKVTVLWCVFFAGNALLISALALLGPLSWWEAYTSLGLYLAAGVLQTGEFLVRKCWFRYYDDTLLDRLWSALLPPENTAQGRRSMEHIRRMRSRT